MSEAATRDLGALPIEITYCMPTSDEVRLVHESTFVVGRGSSANAVFNHSELSRKHFKIEQISGRIYVTDLNSSNGTYLNGKRIEPSQPQEVMPEDKIGFGGPQLYYFKVSIGGPQSTSENGLESNLKEGGDQAELQLVEPVSDDTEESYIEPRDDDGLSFEDASLVDPPGSVKKEQNFNSLASQEEKEAFHDIRRAEALLKGLETKKKNVQIQVDNLSRAREGLEKKLKENNSKLEQLEAAVIAYQNKSKELENDIDHLQKDQENEKEKIQVLYEEKKKVIEDKNKVLEEIKSHKSTIVDLQNNIENTKLQLETDRESAQAEKESLDSQLETFRNETHEAIRELDERRKKHLGDEKEALEEADKAREKLSVLQGDITIQTKVLTENKAALQEITSEIASQTKELNQQIDTFQYYVGANEKILEQHKQLDLDHEKAKHQFDEFNQLVVTKKNELAQYDRDQEKQRSQLVIRMKGLTEKLDELEDELAIRKSGILEQEENLKGILRTVEGKKKEIGEANQEYNNKINELNILKSSEEKVKGDIKELEDNRASATHQLEELHREIEEKGNELELKEQIIEQHDDKVSAINTEMAKLNHKLEELQGEKSSLLDEIENIKSEKIDLENDFEMFKSDLQGKRSQTELDFESFNSLVASSRKEIEKSFEAEKEELESERVLLQKHLEDFEEEIEKKKFALNNELEHINLEIEEKVRNQSEYVKTEVTSYRTKLEAELNGLKNQMHQVEIDIQQLDKHKESKEEMLEREFQAKQDHLDREFKDARERYQSLEAEIQQFKKEKSQLELELDDGFKNLEKLGKATEQSEATVQGLRSEIHKLDSQRLAFEREKDESASSLKAYKTEVADKMKALDAQHNVKKSELLAEQKKIEIKKLDLEKEYKSLQEALDQNKIVLEETKNEEQQYRVDVERHQLDLQRLNKESENESSKIQELIARREELEEAAERLTGELEAREQEMVKKESSLEGILEQERKEAKQELELELTKIRVNKVSELESELNKVRREEEKRFKVVRRQILDTLKPLVEQELESLNAGEGALQRTDRFLRQVITPDDVETSEQIRSIAETTVQGVVENKKHLIRISSIILGTGLAIFLIFITVKFDLVDRGLAALISGETAQEKYTKKKIAEREEARKFRPEMTAEFKSTYADNVLYTTGYIDQVTDEVYQGDWILEVNTFVNEKLKMNEEIVPRLVAMESVLISDLAKARSQIIPELEESARLSMLEREDRFMREALELLRTEENYKKFYQLHSSFFKKFK
tara:strand:+ start:12175 stop:15990 length:3816 start_codon:yes stop_codon:yes gene_type:complete